MQPYAGPSNVYLSNGDTMHITYTCSIPLSFGSSNFNLRNTFFYLTPYGLKPFFLVILQLILIFVCLVVFVLLTLNLILLIS